MSSKSDEISADLVAQLQQHQLDAALQNACLTGNCEALLVLLGHGANPNHEDDFGASMFHYASRAGKEDIMEALVRHGVTCEDVTVEGEPLVIWAARKGFFNLFRVLVEERQVDVEETDTAGRLPIHIACIEGHPLLVEYLIQSGTSPVDKTDVNGWTPLHYSCTEGKKEYRRIMQYLISSGANLMRTNPEGKTALGLAYESGRLSFFADVVSTRDLLSLVIFIDKIVPAKGTAKVGADQKRRQSLKFPTQQDFLSTQDKVRSQGMLFGIWRKILQYDDTDLLILYRDSKIWKDPNNPKAFEEAQNFDEQTVLSLFNSCFENGLGVHAYIDTTYRAQIDGGDFRHILRDLTELTEFEPVQRDGCEILPAPHQTLIVLALICGRIKVVELLLRMRQFDLIPMALLCVLISRKLAKGSSIPPHGKQIISEFAIAAESIAVDAVSRVYLTDRSSGKTDCLGCVDLPELGYSNQSWIDLADKAHCTDFLSVQCCQEALDKRWFGKLSPLPPFWRWICVVWPIMYIIYAKKEHYAETREVARQRKITRREDVQTAKMTKTSNGGPEEEIHEIPDRKDEQVSSLVTFSPKQQIHLLLDVFHSPFYKFLSHSATHFLFLIIFSYVALKGFFFNPSNLEIFCGMFIFGYAVEEVRQFYIVYNNATTMEYAKDARNWMDGSAIILCLTGISVRVYRIGHMDTHTELEEAHDTVLYWARAFLLTGLLLFYLRILSILSISAVLGPKLKMMGNMLVKDLLPLLLIFAIFVVGFGVVFEALLYPNGYPLAGKRNTALNTFSNSFKRAVYGMFVSEYPLEELDCEGKPTCPNKTGADLVLYFYNVIYILIVNIMLINLLIALFSNTVARIDERSKDHWLADRYNMIKEFKQRSILPPPANMICVVFEIVTFVLRHVRGVLFRARSVILHAREDPMRVFMRHLVLQGFALRDHRYSIGRKSRADKEAALVNFTNTAETLLRRMEDKLHHISSTLDTLTTSLIDEDEIQFIDQVIPQSAKPTDRQRTSSDGSMTSFLQHLENLTQQPEC